MNKQNYSLHAGNKYAFHVNNNELSQYKENKLVPTVVVVQQSNQNGV